MQTFLRRSLVVGSFAFTVPCSAQCLEWDERFFTVGTNGEVSAVATFDDGSGAALYVGGSFYIAGPLYGYYIARWDGETWSALGSGVNGFVKALAVFDDGSGPALYAGGEFTTAGGASVNGVAKWNGTSWSSLGSGLASGSPGSNARSLAVFDDGSGPALFVGGVFTSAGGVAASRIAKWNGTSWSPLGAGTDFYVASLAVFDDGSGAALYAGGVFTNAGGAPANRIAKWNGTSWSALGSGVSAAPFDTPQVDSLAAFDDGTGSALYAGGLFTLAGGVSAHHIAKWNGTSWSALGSGMDSYVYALSVFDPGTGPALYAGGRFTSAGGDSANRIAKWNGTAWSALSSAVSNSSGEPTVRALAVFDDGMGSALHVGGSFRYAEGMLANNIAKWDGTSWSRIGAPGLGVTGTVYSMTRFDDGDGEELYAGGLFDAAGGTLTAGVAKFDGASWSALGSGVSASGQAVVYALCTFDDGTGPALYAGGTFGIAGGTGASHIAKWNGTSWSNLGSGTNGFAVQALCVFDDGTGPALYAGGDFDLAGGVSASRIAKWNGSTWSALGSGITAPFSATVYSVAVFDDGAGPALYAGGDYRQAGGATAWCIAKWNGTSWSSFGNGVTAGNVFALTVHDDGTGAALYAGGSFELFVGVSAMNVAKWNGTSWSAVGAGFAHDVRSLCAFDDGSGSSLYAGGPFVTSGVTGYALGKWDGASWVVVDGNVGGSAYSLSVFDDGADGAADLYVGGNFLLADYNNVDRKPSFGIAQLHGCPPGDGYCFGDGLDPVVTAQCPCTNFGDAGHGCANSIFASGGRLIASGTTNPNTVLFMLSNVPNNTLATGFSNVSNTGPGGVVFGDGVRCQSGALVRFGSHNTGTLGDAPNTWSSPAFPISPGLTRYYQIQYRNSAPAFCPPATFNISNGYRIAW